MRIVSILVAGALLAGCTMTPDYLAPKTDAPPRFQYAGDAAASWPDPAWWQGFGSAELDAMLAEAHRASPDLAAALARIEQAEAQSRSAAAALYPSLGTGGSIGRATSNPGGQGTIVRMTYQGNLQAAYQVDLLGRYRAEAAAGRTRLEATQYDYEAVALTLNAQIAVTYFQALALRDRIRLTNEQLRNADGILELLEQQARIGVGTDLELAQQRNAIASQRASLQGIMQSEREAVNALAVLVGRLPSGFAARTQSLNELRAPAVVAGLPSELLQRRPDIRAAEAGLRAANFDIGSARAARFPSIQLTGTAGVTSATLSHIISPGSFLTSLVAGLTVPIFEGGRLEAQEDATRARYRELVANYSGAVLSAFRDTENALSASDLYNRQYQLAQEALQQAIRAYQLAEARYRAGAVDFISVLDAQRSVFQATDAVAQANLARLSSLVDLYEALGGGWDGSVRTASAP
ncbi:MAG: efflux transporter outer membrane subunit [Reyranellaceae bacterium]